MVRVLVLEPTTEKAHRRYGVTILRTGGRLSSGFFALCPRGTVCSEKYNLPLLHVSLSTSVFVVHVIVVSCLWVGCVRMSRMAPPLRVMMALCAPPALVAFVVNPGSVSRSPIATPARSSSSSPQRATSAQVCCASTGWYGYIQAASPSGVGVVGVFVVGTKRSKRLLSYFLS